MVDRVDETSEIGFADAQATRTCGAALSFFLRKSRRYVARRQRIPMPCNLCDRLHVLPTLRVLLSLCSREVYPHVIPPPLLGTCPQLASSPGLQLCLACQPLLATCSARHAKQSALPVVTT